MSTFRWNGRTGWPRRSQERDRLSSSLEPGFSFPRSGRTHSIGCCAAIGPADQSDPYDSASHEPNPHQRGTSNAAGRPTGPNRSDADSGSNTVRFSFPGRPGAGFTTGQKLLDVGDQDMAVWLVVEGSIVASRRD